VFECVVCVRRVCCVVTILILIPQIILILKNHSDLPGLVFLTSTAR
jgi:hypothetical protein